MQVPARCSNTRGEGDADSDAVGEEVM